MERLHFMPSSCSTPKKPWTNERGGDVQSPVKCQDLAFSMSLSPNHSLKTHSFPHGQAFVRRDTQGRCNFTWEQKPDPEPLLLGPLQDPPPQVTIIPRASQPGVPGLHASPETGERAQGKWIELRVRAGGLSLITVLVPCRCPTDWSSLGRGNVTEGSLWKSETQSRARFRGTAQLACSRTTLTAWARLKSPGFNESPRTHSGSSGFRVGSSAVRRYYGAATVQGAQLGKGKRGTGIGVEGSVETE
ncbi:hypothetical protein WMY93_029016 [Mugilogobius chulae]|uniref:Uncharacterized protein n=1 Tax=Mugilogobius chulae TaxID=88201 RepID=A0AAW0N0A9_9GOBI